VPSRSADRRLVGLVRATHAPPTVAVTGYATATAVASGLGARSAVLACAVLVGQASVGWSNDWIDAPRDIAVDRHDKPIVDGLVERNVVGVAALLALTACVPLSFALGWRAGIAHLVAVVAAWSYNFGLKRTVVSFAPYFLAFGLVPVVVAMALPEHRWPAWALITASGLLGVAAHITNAVEDIDVDRVSGVLGLPQRLGVRWGTVLATATTAAAGAIFLTAPGRLTPVGVSLVAVGVALATVSMVRALRGRTTGLFATSILAALPLVVAVAATGGVGP
jgi:4-hydroxybenzoate polyprenyltransferase